MARKRNRRYGGAIAETGPALFLFFVCVFFPMLDLLYIVAGYGFGWFLHSTEVRECSVRKPDNSAGSQYVKIADDDFFKNAKGMAEFLGFNDANRSTRIRHDGPVFTDGANGAPGEVRLTTSVDIKPWLYIPFIPGVPGLSKDIPVSFTTIRPQEESGRDG
jgi:hypothetical protein